MRSLQGEAPQERGGELGAEEGQKGAGSFKGVFGGGGDEAAELASQPRVPGRDVQDGSDQV